MGRYHPTFAPFRASGLSFTTGPSSPKSPLTIKTPKFKSTKKARHSPVSPSLRSFRYLDLQTKWTDAKTQKTSLERTREQMAEPEEKESVRFPEPEPWLWQCHRCQTHYRLGTSRRCLHDGHYFCGGTTTDMKGNIKRHAACGSEFDYAGWERILLPREKKAELLSLKTSGKKATNRHCAERCAYPSACHWKLQEEEEEARRKEEEGKARECDGQVAAAVRAGAKVNRDVKNVHVHALPSPNRHRQTKQCVARETASFDFLPFERRGSIADDEEGQCRDDAEEQQEEDDVSPTETVTPVDSLPSAACFSAKEKRRSASSTLARFWVKTAAQLGGLFSSTGVEMDSKRLLGADSRGLEAEGGTSLDLPYFKRLRQRDKEEGAFLGEGGGLGGWSSGERGMGEEVEVEVEDIDMTDLVSPVSDVSMESEESSEDEEEREKEEEKLGWERLGRAYGGWRVSH